MDWKYPSNIAIKKTTMPCIYNQNGIDESKIRYALGLEEDKCEIKKVGDTYIIRSNTKEKELLINIIRKIDNNDGAEIYLFQLFNLTFEYCIFGCEVKLEVFEDIKPQSDKKISKCDTKLPIDKKIKFKNCTFQKAAYFISLTLNRSIIFQKSIFESIVLFTKSNFNSKAEFAGCIFQNEADFSNSTFYQEVNFTQTIFKASAYFDNATFRSNADFERSEFCKNAHFYQTEFSQNPNFFQTTFNEHLNLTDAKIHNEDPNIADMPIFNFDFEDLEKEVQTCSEADKFRDIFKNIKNALIKSGNLLGASRFRKMELYCKEIELDLKKKENRETSTRDFVDRIQLYCYRLTSDHHTDLLLILNNVIFLIALFGVANFVLLVSQCDIIQLAFLKINYIKLLEVTICIIYVSLIIYIMLNCCSIIHFVIFLPIFSLVFYLHPTYVIFMVLTFCVLILCLMLLSCFQSKLKENLVKQCIFGISYFIVILMFIFKPSLLIPILGKLIEDKSSKSYCCDDFDIFECCLNTTSFASETLNLIYMLFLFLLLWSLQKTARKNTIVPN